MLFECYCGISLEIKHRDEVTILFSRERVDFPNVVEEDELNLLMS